MNILPEEGYLSSLASESFRLFNLLLVVIKSALFEC